MQAVTIAAIALHYRMHGPLAPYWVAKCFENDDLSKTEAPL